MLKGPAMRLWKTTLPFMLAVVVASQAALAGGFVQKLPKDGTWVEYNIEAKGDAGGTAIEMSGTMKLKSVGTVTENGEKYRWIEIDSQMEVMGMKQRSVMKALAREKDFKADAKGPVKILRGWQQNQRGDTKMEAKKLTDEELSPTGQMSFLFGPKLKREKTIKSKKTIEYQKGKLEIATASTGEMEIKTSPNAPAEFKQKGKLTIWMHKAVPTGTAAMQMQMETLRKEMKISNMKMTISVQDYGKGAKSALPENK